MSSKVCFFRLQTPSYHLFLSPTTVSTRVPQTLFVHMPRCCPNEREMVTMCAAQYTETSLNHSNSFHKSHEHRNVSPPICSEMFHYQSTTQLGTFCITPCHLPSPRYTKMCDAGSNFISKRPTSKP